MDTAEKNKSSEQGVCLLCFFTYNLLLYDFSFFFVQAMLDASALKTGFTQIQIPTRTLALIMTASLQMATTHGASCSLPPVPQDLPA